MSSDNFETLYANHREDFFRFARSLTNSPSSARDLVQDALIKAYLKRNTIENPERFKPWVNKILYNTQLSHYRKRKRRLRLMDSMGRGDSLFFNISTCANRGYEEMKAQDILNIMESISPKGTTAFHLWIKGYKYREIASKLDISTGTVKSRIHSTRHKLQKLCANFDVGYSNPQLN